MMEKIQLLLFHAVFVTPGVTHPRDPSLVNLGLKPYMSWSSLELYALEL